MNNMQFFLLIATQIFLTLAILSFNKDTQHDSSNPTDAKESTVIVDRRPFMADVEDAPFLDWERRITLNSDGMIMSYSAGGYPLCKLDSKEGQYLARYIVKNGYPIDGKSPSVIDVLDRYRKESKKQRKE